MLREWMVLISCLAVFVAVGFCEEEASEDLSFEFTSDFYGKYIWRGQNLDDEPVFQPGLSVGFGNFTASIWGSMELTNQNGEAGDFTEVDYSLDYSGQLSDVVGYSFGVIYYDFPNTDLADTTEAYVGVSLDMPLSPSVTYYLDVDEAKGSYLEFALSYSQDCVTEISGLPVGLEAGMAIGWGDSDYNEYYWGTTDSEMQALSLSLSLPVAVGEWTVSPSLNYVTLLSDKLRETDSYSTDSDYLFAGIGISRSF